MNKIEVVNLSKQSKRFEKSIKKSASKILEILNKTGLAVEIYLIDGRKMRLLNKKFRGKDKTTTILSFEEPRNFILPASKFRKIGEIYLSADQRGPYAEQRGKSQRKSAFSQRQSALLIHGLLHLLGYNHQQKNDRIKMESKERKLLKFLIF